MTIEIKVPILPESVSDATVAKWYKKKGDSITRDENLVDLETDKIMLEVIVPKDGIIKEIKVKEGEVVKANQLLALLEEEDLGRIKVKEKKEAKRENKKEKKAIEGKIEEVFSPAVRRLVAEKAIDVTKIEGSGKGGRLTKKDVEDYLETQKEPFEKEISTAIERMERRVPLSRIRQRIAKRLVQVQHEAALLTTFNEINMKLVMDVREKYRNKFEKKFNVRLGLMSFFIKAAIEALKQFPMVNASIDGSDIIYHDYYDIGIAIGTERGLVVPILRNVENMSMVELEKQIREFASRAQKGRLNIDELTGGTFTITNGGTYGSLLSTPIINPPQTAILGMHKIIERPIVENGEIVVRPIMMLALSYDHRVIDGREAILFLVVIKEILEDPIRILLEV